MIVPPSSPGHRRARPTQRVDPLLHPLADPAAVPLRNALDGRDLIVNGGNAGHGVQPRFRDVGGGCPCRALGRLAGARPCCPLGRLAGGPVKRLGRQMNLLPVDPNDNAIGNLTQEDAIELLAVLAAKGDFGPRLVFREQRGGRRRIRVRFRLRHGGNSGLQRASIGRNCEIFRVLAARGNRPNRAHGAAGPSPPRTNSVNAPSSGLIGAPVASLLAVLDAMPSVAS